MEFIMMGGTFRFIDAADERTENAAFYTDKDGWGSASVFLVRWNGIVKTENVI